MKTVEKTKNPIPKFRHHKASGRAYVVLNQRAFWLGKSGTEEAEQNYNKTIAEWLSSGNKLLLMAAILHSLKYLVDFGCTLKELLPQARWQSYHRAWIACDTHFDLC